MSMARPLRVPPRLIAARMGRPSRQSLAGAFAARHRARWPPPGREGLLAAPRPLTATLHASLTFLGATGGPVPLAAVRGGAIASVWCALEDRRQD